MEQQTGSTVCSAEPDVETILQEEPVTFQDYIRGKRVVLIGASASLMGSEQRDVIEEHDVVCRINRGFPVPEQMKVDIGERTDVLYHLLTVHIASGEDEFRQLIGKVKWVIGVHGESHPKTIAFKRLNKGRVAFETTPTYLRGHVKNSIIKAPNAGIMAITHLLTLEPKELYLTGFTFYDDGYYVGYGGRNQHQSAALKGGQPGHHQPSQKVYVRRLLEHYKDIVKMDKPMREALEVQLPLRQAGPITPNGVMLVARVPLRRKYGLILRGEQFIASPEEAKQFLEKRKALPA